MAFIYLFASIVSILFILVKWIELKYIVKEENISFKYIVRDAVVVFFAVIGGQFIYDQVNTMMGDIAENITPVFTDNPEF